MRSPGSVKLAAVAVCVCFAIACHRRQDPDEAELTGEPEQFSAIVVHWVDDGVERELDVTRIFKSGNLRREEWLEQGGSRALIWRPDLGRMYLLDVDGRGYVETDITPSDALKPGQETNTSQDAEYAARRSASVRGDQVRGEAVDRAFDDSPSPVRIETRSLPDQTIDGHPSAVIERRTVFANDYVETTVTFRARDFNGLAIRVETGPGAGTKGSKLITSWRDIRRDVPADVFDVPPDFRRVDKLP